jgi:outer membrane protein assembly factor BamD
LEEYDKLLNLYPQSTHVEAAKQRIAECRQSLARSEFVAGFFYQRTRRAYRAAIARYDSILTRFPEYRQTDEVLFRLAESLNLAGRSEEARPHLARLLQEYPQSAHAESARKLMARLSVPSHKSPEPPAAREAAPQGVSQDR